MNVIFQILGALAFLFVVFTVLRNIVAPAVCNCLSIMLLAAAPRLEKIFPPSEPRKSFPRTNKKSIVSVENVVTYKPVKQLSSSLPETTTAKLPVKPAEINVEPVKRKAKHAKTARVEQSEQLSLFPQTHELDNFLTMIRKHDMFYGYSDDTSQWKHGEQERESITIAAQQLTSEQLDTARNTWNELSQGQCTCPF